MPSLGSFAAGLPPCPPRVPVHTHLIARPMVVPFPNRYVNEMMRHVAPYVWPLSHSTTGPSRAGVCIGGAFLLVVK